MEAVIFIGFQTFVLFSLVFSLHLCFKVWSLEVQPSHCPESFYEYYLDEEARSDLSCLPPPSDHAAKFSNNERSSAAICLFDRLLQEQNLTLKIPHPLNLAKSYPCD